MALKTFKKQLLLNGKPKTLLFAEFHYYRTPKHLWKKRLELIIEAGFDGIASYIPWLIHETKEKDFDFTGKYRGEHDLVSFIELLKSHHLFFIPRPGPFIMAEMKNDGIPFWVYEKYPDIKPITWNHKQGTTVTVDYMNENYLSASKKYYEQIIPLLSKYLYPNGNIVAMQLDNEVGMLSWVSNNPELNDSVLESFISYLKTTYKDVNQRYDFIDSSLDVIAEKVRKPEESYLNKLHVDIGYFFRKRLSDYIDILKTMANELGFSNQLMIINIHGCSQGRTMTYPIGLSQLYDSYYQKPDMISGSDVYIYDFTVPNLQDTYMANILTDATNDEDQPLTSLEFSAGTGDYGNNFSQRYSTSRIDFLTRSFIALGNRLLNYYTFVGGRNYRFDFSLGDGNDRIATTGETHGYAAPIDPFGQKSYVYQKTKEVIHLIKNHGNFLATQMPILDNITYGFIPDYFMTEFHYPDIKNEIHQNLTKYRAGSFWDVVVKSLLLLNYNFDATDLQKKDLDPNKLCILPSASYMPKEVQQKLVDFLKQDGKLLLYGELPRFDLEGNSCTLLVDYFNLEFIRNEEHKRHPFRTSIVAHQFISDRPELHRPYYQTWKSKDEKDVLFSVYHLNEACGFFFNESKKHAALITAEYRSDLDMFDQIIKLFGIEKRIHVTNNLYHGLFAIETKNELDEGYLHLINLDDFDKTFDISTPTIQNKSLFIEQRSALMLPINLEIVNGLTIRYSSNEIQYFDEEKIIISLNGPTFECMIDTHKEIFSNDPTVEIVRNKTSVFIRKSKRYYDEKTTELLIK